MLIIIITLAGILLPVIMGARRQGLITKCKSNMKQIGHAIIMYRDDHMHRGKELNPPWLRTLTKVNAATGVAEYLPERVKNKKDILLCPLDTSYGIEGGKPNVLNGKGLPVTQYAELDEGSSFMYEFSMAAVMGGEWEWKSYLTLPDSASGREDAFVDLDGRPAITVWGGVKTAQMRYGDNYNNNGIPKAQWRGYSPTRFPLMRCFWHVEDPDTNLPSILNLAYQGNLFLSGAEWERTAVH